MTDSGSWGRAQAPARWAQALPPHELPGAIATYNRPLSREELRELCRDPAVDVLDLSRIYAAPITRLGCLAFEGQGAFAPQS
jgi:hypothetical protein